MKKIMIATILVILSLVAISFLGLYKPKISEPNQAKTAASSKGIIDAVTVDDSKFSNGENAGDYYQYNYNCNWNGLAVECTGEVGYIGPQEYNINNTHLDLWCFDKRECFISTDKVSLTPLTQSYNLSCFIGEKKDIKAILAVVNTNIIYTMRPDCEK